MSLGTCVSHIWLDLCVSMAIVYEDFTTNSEKLHVT